MSAMTKGVYDPISDNEDMNGDDDKDEESYEDLEAPSPIKGEEVFEKTDDVQVCAADNEGDENESDSSFSSDGSLFKEYERKQNKSKEGC